MASKYKSWAFTISLKDEDFEGKIQERFEKWLKKQDYAWGVVEHDNSGKRHAHAQIWNENPSKKGDISRSASRMIAELHPNSVIFRALKVVIAYSDGFSEYQEKDIIDTIIDNPPTGDTSIYYPSEEEQQKVQAESHAVDKKFHRWKTDFLEWNETQIEIKDVEDLKHQQLLYKERVASFLSHKIYVSKEYPVIQEKRKRIEATQNLYNYITGKKCISQFISEKDQEQLKNIVCNNFEE